MFGTRTISFSRHATFWRAATNALVIAFVGLIPRIASAQLGAKPSSIVMDAESGLVLQADNPDERRFPASLTKMMTLYMSFEALRGHRITLHRLVPVSAHAASMEPTKLWLVPGTRITVQQCILGMVTISANDAAAAMGELLGGTEHQFARKMTRRAHALGMRHTVFRNASGLPDAAQVTTARDMAILARALISEFPKDYRYFSIRSFVFHGRTIYGHDPLLGTYAGVDGLKTGYTSAAGYNLATSAVRNGVRIIAIILGAPSIPQRSLEMIGLLDESFAHYGAPSEIPPSGSDFSTPHLIATADAAERPLPSAVASMPSGALAARAHRTPPTGYSVQVGSFTSHGAALHAVRLTIATVGGVAHVRRFMIRGRPIWRAQVVSLTRSDALHICPPHARNAGHCSIIQPNGRRWRPMPTVGIHNTLSASR